MSKVIGEIDYKDTKYSVRYSKSIVKRLKELKEDSREVIKRFSECDNDLDLGKVATIYYGIVKETVGEDILDVIRKSDNMASECSAIVLTINMMIDRHERGILNEYSTS